jgi:hypothetical protein
VHSDKLLYAFEHDVFPLWHCKLKESHRHKLGGFWPAYCELAHVRRAFHRRLLAEAELATSKDEIRHGTPDLKLPLAIRSRALRAEGSIHCEPTALRVKRSAATIGAEPCRLG